MRKIIFFVPIIFFLILGIIFWSHIRAAYIVLGFDHPKEYIVLLQNNMELRSSGGFMGSFARIKLSRGKFELLKIEDIYVPDGQLDGHVDPPWPIQAAFGQGWFKLRDSNWDPDFPSSAKTIAWFFEHGKERPADGLIAVNLNLLKSLLKLSGPIYLVDESEKISYDNFYKKTQAAVEEDFFPGSTQKSNFLNKLGRAVFNDISNMSFVQKMQLPLIGIDLLKNRQILIYVNDDRTQSLMGKLGFDGGLLNVTKSGNDYISLFENNLGANKANCCINRKVNLVTQKDSGVLHHVLKIDYENTNPVSLKKPPQYWGGAYVNYLRIGIPITAKITEIKVGEKNYPIPSEDASSDIKTNEQQELVNLMNSSPSAQLLGFITGSDPQHLRVDLEKREEKSIQLVGLFVLVDALSSQSVEVKYDDIYSSTICLQKQSGIELMKVTINNSDLEIRNTSCVRY
jgi:hypothetical protein